MGTNAAAVATNPKLPYDPRTDFDYLGLINLTPNLLIVRKDLPVSTLQEFTAYAKAKGKDLKMGHNGIGSLAHLTCLVYFQLIDVEPTYVVYRGFGQTINDILVGAIDGTCDLTASVAGHAQGGSVKYSAWPLTHARLPFRMRLQQRRKGCPDSRSRAGLASTRRRAYPGRYSRSYVRPS